MEKIKKEKVQAKAEEESFDSILERVIELEKKIGSHVELKFNLQKGYFERHVSPEHTFYVEVKSLLTKLMQKVLDEKKKELESLAKTNKIVEYLIQERMMLKKELEKALAENDLLLTGDMK